MNGEATGADITGVEGLPIWGKRMAAPAGKALYGVVPLIPIEARGLPPIPEFPIPRATAIPGPMAWLSPKGMAFPTGGEPKPPPPNLPDNGTEVAGGGVPPPGPPLLRSL